MKKFSLIFLVICLLLSACGGGTGSRPLPPEETAPPPAESPDQEQQTPPTEQPPQESQQPTEPLGSLLDRAESIGEQGNLLLLPNDSIEAMSAPQIHILAEGEQLLLCQPVFSAERSDTELAVISLHDGRLLAETSLFTSAFAQVQAGGDFICVSDSANGSITVFDTGLQQLNSFKIEQDFENWFMSMDASTLYILTFQEGIFKLNLQSGEKSPVMEDAELLTVIGSNPEFVVFSYMDANSGSKRCASLNLIDGSIENAPQPMDSAGAERVESTWLFSQPNGTYHSLFRNGVEHEIAAEPGRLKLLYPSSRILAISQDGRALQLYTGDGAYISSCALPEGNRSLIQNFVWSDLLEGWLFVDKAEDGCRLMLWDPQVPTQGEALSFVQPSPPPQQTVSAQLYQRAQEMQERYGIEIAIAEQCELEYSHFSSYMLTDENFINDCFDILEDAFSKYPPGFLEQLKCGYISRIRVELVGGLTCTDTSTLAGDSAAFAQRRDDYYLIVADGFMLTDRVIYHELAHVIDFRLEWDAARRPDALFSEEAWLAQQPEGFDYAYSYVDVPESVLQFSNSGYFVSDYSCTFPGEDRATLMSAAMQDIYNFEGNPGMRSKLAFLSLCIRDSFDTEGWPEQTHWERFIGE